MAVRTGLQPRGRRRSGVGDVERGNPRRSGVSQGLSEAGVIIDFKPRKRKK